MEADSRNPPESSPGLRCVPTCATQKSSLNTPNATVRLCSSLETVCRGTGTHGRSPSPTRHSCGADWAEHRTQRLRPPTVSPHALHCAGPSSGAGNSWRRTTRSASAGVARRHACRAWARRRSVGAWGSREGAWVCRQTNGHSTVEGVGKGGAGPRLRAVRDIKIYKNIYCQKMCEQFLIESIFGTESSKNKGYGHTTPPPQRLRTSHGKQPTDRHNSRPRRVRGTFGLAGRSGCCLTSHQHPHDGQGPGALPRKLGATAGQAGRQA